MDIQGGMGGGGGAGFDFMSWYMDIPVISRLYFTSAFLTSAGCALEIISPFSLYYNFDLIFLQGQAWRLLTTYLFFGTFSIDFLFHMYFLVRYCRLLEEGDFRGKTANFALFLLFGCSIMTLVAPFVSVHFLGSSLTFMMVYVWGRRNEDTRMSFLGMFQFTAPYLPWVMLTFSVLLGQSVTIDAIGILVGHMYYFLEYVYPIIADIRGWRVKRIMEPPRLLHWLCGTYQEPIHLHQD
mmetsp:Transcript_19216/g.24470  ORF Transcript_19216/g.24470 Transcript_19216/m.24470 type:complete len:238 (+) Transcript_19216:136-849(+)